MGVYKNTITGVDDSIIYSSIVEESRIDFCAKKVQTLATWDGKKFVLVEPKEEYRQKIVSNLDRLGLTQVGDDFYEISS